MDLSLTPRVKVIALAGILAAVTMVGGMQFMARSQAQSAAAPLPVTRVRHAAPAPAVKPAKPAAKPAAKAATHKTRASVHRAHKATAATKPTAAPKPAANPAVTVGAAPAPAPAPTTAAAAAAPPTAPAPPAVQVPTAAAGATVATGLPVSLAAALRKSPVVVAATFDPQSQVDAIAFAEAQAGAKAAGVGFLPVNLLDKLAATLTAWLPGGGLLPDPGVLVIKRDGTIATRFDGFADRDMVAQAAFNALH